MKDIAIILGFVLFLFVGGRILYQKRQQAYAPPAAPPPLPATQDPNDPNGFCKAVVGTAATAVATY